MAIVPWRPFFDISPFPEDEDWLLPMIPKEKFMPAMDLYETGKEVIAEINVPGIDPEKTEVTVDNGILKVKVEGGEKKEEKKKDYWKKEISHRSFERMVRIPIPVNEKKVEATYKKGILKIVMPKSKTAKAKGKRIKVRTK